MHYLGFLFFFLSNRGKTHKESIEDVDWFEIRKPQLVPVPDREREKSFHRCIRSTLPRHTHYFLHPSLLASLPTSLNHWSFTNLPFLQSDLL